jgi:BASS family bile acid:Na+ symporter
MSAVTQFLEVTFGPLVVIFTASNLAVMGLQVKSAEVIAGLKNPKILALIVLWGWVLGPALGYLIAWALPLSEAFVIGLLLYSLAPCAPFFPLMVPKARGDMSFAGAVVPLVAVGTVIFMPLMAPVLITGVTLSAWAIAKMFLVSVLLPLAIGAASREYARTVLLPLAIGAAIREYARTVATKILPAVNLIAKLSTLATIVYACLLYWREMLATAGSFGLLSMTIFMVVMGVITYRRFGFGLKQSERSVMSLAMLTRNGAVVLLAALTIPDVDPGIITYVVMFVIASIVVAAIAARIFGKLAGETVAGNTV